METNVILYAISTLLLSVLIAYFQYFYKAKNRQKINFLLFGLRTISIFLLFLLLINPTIEKQELQNEKPLLSVLVDNSASIKFFKEEKNVTNLLRQLKENTNLNDKFQINYFSFGNSLQVLDSLTFNKPQTNISNALQSVDDLYKNSNALQLLISDGNQTLGDTYEYINIKQTIHPFMIGDTTLYKDVRISQLNVNKYNYIKNKFPVETLLYYEGNENVTTQFSIYNKGKVVYKKALKFSPINRTQTVTANLQSNKEGLHYYTASVQQLTNEKNTKNNTKKFSIEVLDEQTKVLIVTSLLHPDIGALKKAIESNKQRSVVIENIDNFKNQLNEFQLIILYQPNNKFNNLITKIKQDKQNYLMVSGKNTDWSFINKQSLGFRKNAIRQMENYIASYYDKFPTFFQKDINFKSFPPLMDFFGEITLSKKHQILLYQNTSGITTSQPLLATFNEGDQKWATLFGEGIWKWRAAHFLETNNFEGFDAFIGNFIQYLASNKKRERLVVNAKKLYPSNATVVISAFYVDENYQFDSRASLWLNVTHLTSKKTKKAPFSLANNSYQIEIEGLEEGDYVYTVTVDNQNSKKKGRFKITNSKVEKQFTNANKEALERLANGTGGKLYYTGQEIILINNLIADNNYKTVQKTIIKKQNLIDWQWILLLTIGVLSTEWLIRKYYGKV